MLQFIHMKTISYTKICICLVILIFPFATFAFTGFQPFGGRITTVKTPPNVLCTTNTQSPFMISPVIGSVGPWSAMFGTVNIGQITPGAWILGLIQSGPGSCVTESTPPVAYPTTVTNFYGTNMGSGGSDMPI